MLFKPSDIEYLKVCIGLAKTLDEFYDYNYINNPIYLVGSKNYRDAENIIFGLYDLILKIDSFFYANKYHSVDCVERFNLGVQSILKNSSNHNIVLDISVFFSLMVEFLNGLNDLPDYRGEFELDVKRLLRMIQEFNANQKENKFKLSDLYHENKELGAKNISDDEISNASLKLMIEELKEKYEDIFMNDGKQFWVKSEQKLLDFQNKLKDSHNEFKNKSESFLEKFSDEINLSKISFQKGVQDEILSFQTKLKDADDDFKSTVKDFEVLKKFINAKGEKEVTDHYRNKAKWERITYWLMTIITFGIIILSVCMAIKGLDEYKEKANISVETLLEKYKDQPVEKIEKIYSAVQSSALTYLVLRLIFSVLLFSSIIYTSRVAYRAYIHMRHSENMMLKLATLRPFINQLDESERNQIHKDLVPDYFGKDAGLVDSASEKFKDLPANVSAVAMKAIEQIGGSTGTSNAKSPDPKDAKTAGE
ncbi:hypothetical protein ACUM6W_02730 [Acinetobacter tandoii]|uniref:hypothetical protein n=1 Tax=Acinetobacter tandoii TaxID=202954 RepID=UPI004045211C